jgi:hypothetical protein
MLELAWIDHKKADPMTAANVDNEQPQKLFGIALPRAYWFDTTKCYILLVLGLLFFAVGAYSSVVDIVRIYQS